MKDKLTEQQTIEILKALDEAIEQGPWDESNFLRVIGKNLREIRADYVRHIESSIVKTKEDTFNANRLVARSGFQEVYVSLYSSEGTNLQAWERILINLPRQMISRPIYENENDLIQLIKSKANKANEAYVAIYINTNDILAVTVDKTPLDKLGKPLLVLKDRSLNLENVSRFVHFSGDYVFYKNRLIRKQVAE